jgi:hypothetical protein
MLETVDPSSEAIVQAKSNHVELITEGCVERCGDTGRRKKRGDSNCFGAKIDKLIFDLRTPMLVEQPFRPAACGPAGPDCG